MARKSYKKLSWDDHIAKRKSDLKDYKTSQSYYLGDYIDHQSFGTGFVENSFGNKIEVLFEDKKRTLVHMVMF